MPEIPVSAVTCPELSRAFILYVIHLMITSSYLYASYYYNMDLPRVPIIGMRVYLVHTVSGVYSIKATCYGTHINTFFFIIPVFVFLLYMFTVRDGQGRNVFGYSDRPVAIFVFTAQIVVYFAINPRVLAKVFPSSLLPRNREIACE